MCVYSFASKLSLHIWNSSRDAYAGWEGNFGFFTLEFEAFQQLKCQRTTEGVALEVLSAFSLRQSFTDQVGRLASESQGLTCLCHLTDEVVCAGYHAQFVGLKKIGYDN